MGMAMAKQVIKSESQSKHFKDLTPAPQCKLRCLMGIRGEGEKGSKRGGRREQGGLRRRGAGGREALLIPL